MYGAEDDVQGDHEDVRDLRTKCRGSKPCQCFACRVRCMKPNILFSGDDFDMSRMPGGGGGGPRELD